MTRDAAVPWRVDAPIAVIRQRKREATQRLLGETITLSELDWQQPSKLPGWSRAHVATHLSRNADALRRLVHGLLTHQPTVMYPDERERRAAIERGSERRGVDQQIDLDSSAGLLNETFDYLEDSGSEEPVQLSDGLYVNASMLPLVRLDEVVLHHVDFDLGYSLRDVDDEVATWILAFEARQAEATRPDLHLVLRTPSMADIVIGDPDQATLVEGSSADLLGWLTDRGDASRLVGAPELRH